MNLVTQARNALGRAKGYGGCYRCGGTWDYTESHETRYDKRGKACFPLCEFCWQGLTIEERLPYYEALRDSWRRDALGYPEHVSQIDAEWPLIEAAVRAGG